MTEEKKMTWFPVFERIDGKTFLIIGGGRVAERKVERLREFAENGDGASFRILLIAPETKIKAGGMTERLCRPYRAGDEKLGDYVIAATASRELNAEIAGHCTRQGIPVNVVDDPSLCTWLFPAFVRRGNLTVGITTGGSSPAYAGSLRRQIERELPEDIDRILNRMTQLRSFLQSRVPDQVRRAEILRRVLAGMLSGDLSPEQTEEELAAAFAGPDEAQQECAKKKVKKQEILI